MTTGIVNGKDFLVYIGVVAITHSTTCVLTLNMGTIPVTTKDSAHWKATLAGERDWTISCDAMLALDATYGVEELYGVMNSRASVTIKFATVDATDRFYSGMARVTSISPNAPNEAGSTYSATFEGTGKLKFAKT